MSKHRLNKTRTVPHVVGFVWPARTRLRQVDPSKPREVEQAFNGLRTYNSYLTDRLLCGGNSPVPHAHVVDRNRTYNRPVLSGGVTACVHCTLTRVSVKPLDNCKVNPGGEHQWATQLVVKGWSDAS